MCIIVDAYSVEGVLVDARLRARVWWRRVCVRTFVDAGMHRCMKEESRLGAQTHGTSAVICSVRAFLFVAMRTRTHQMA